MFLVFAGSDYYPSGGWNDLAETSESIELAVQSAKAENADWWHVVNTATLQVVACNRCMDYASNPLARHLHLTRTHEVHCGD